ncbi:uracil-DNA glycosylase [Roseicella frigidaeris]|uniref:Uracil-DNA glycosylase n=2 Tax=Roseicella frigidaeris TaxID=2230885 RepID=A0A327MDN0_9PROT|nr:uracil-DNA glycosylase [Roseicella frigidaeris]
MLPTLLHPDDYPRSLGDRAVQERRQAMLDAPHMRALREHVTHLRRRPGVEVPEFDPLDGGDRAQILFLFEKPGPMTSEGRTGRRAGSGFISRNNDDATAAATWHFMRDAGIPRVWTATWNVIPWWNGTVQVTPQELREGLDGTHALLRLFPDLQAIVLVGKKASRIASGLAGTGLTIIESAHPSPRVRAAFPVRWNAIGAQWRSAAAALTAMPPSRS